MAAFGGFSNVGLTVTGTVDAQTKRPSHNLHTFELIRTAIHENKRGNVVDMRIYRASDGSNVSCDAELCGTPERSNQALEEVISKWKSCENFEDVIDVKDRIAGKRAICETGVAQAPNAIVYSYGGGLMVISGESLDTLRGFESQTCVRSKLVAGVPCKY